MTDEIKPEPTHTVAGFRMAAGPLIIEFGYAVFPNGVIHLYVFERLLNLDPRVWRSLIAPPCSALEVAEALIADAQEYLDSVPWPQRPYEDLGPDDFLEHLYSRINNELH